MTVGVTELNCLANLHCEMRPSLRRTPLLQLLWPSGLDLLVHGVKKCPNYQRFVAFVVVRLQRLEVVIDHLGFVGLQGLDSGPSLRRTPLLRHLWSNGLDLLDLIVEGVEEYPNRQRFAASVVVRLQRSEVVIDHLGFVDLQDPGSVEIVHPEVDLEADCTLTGKLKLVIFALVLFVPDSD